MHSPPLKEYQILATICIDYPEAGSCTKTSCKVIIDSSWINDAPWVNYINYAPFPMPLKLFTLHRELVSVRLYLTNH